MWTLTCCGLALPVLKIQNRSAQRVFDELLTARINFQKAVVSAPRIPERGIKRDYEVSHYEASVMISMLC